MGRASVRIAAVDLASALEAGGYSADDVELDPNHIPWETVGYSDVPDDELRDRAVTLLRSRERQPDDFALFRGADR